MNHFIVHFCTAVFATKLTASLARMYDMYLSHMHAPLTLTINVCPCAIRVYTCVLDSHWLVNQGIQWGFQNPTEPTRKLAGEGKEKGRRTHPGLYKGGEVQQGDSLLLLIQERANQKLGVVFPGGELLIVLVLATVYGSWVWHRWIWTYIVGELVMSCPWEPITSRFNILRAEWCQHASTSRVLAYAPQEAPSKKNALRIRKWLVVCGK